MAIISPETIQRIIAETDIVDVISSYFPLKKAGANFLALCPFHNEKTPSFNVTPSKQIYYCFGCGEGGDAIRFVMHYENLTFPDAASRLAEKAGIRLEDEVFDPDADRRLQLRRLVEKLHKEASAWFSQLLFRSPEAQHAREYLKMRGLDSETARRWQLGYAPQNGGSLIRWAQDAGFSNKVLLEGGLAAPQDADNPSRGVYSRFRDRLMFPVCNDYGNVIAFSGRVLSPDAKGGKYINSPETMLFKKSKTFYGLDRSKRPILKAGRAVLCEGQLDLIACVENGIENTVAALGTAFTEDHARILKRHTDEVVLCYDSDAAGYKAAIKAFRQLVSSNLVVKLAAMPAGEDPDSLLKKEGAEAFTKRITEAPEFLDYQIDRASQERNLDEMRDRIEFAKEVSENIARITDKMIQDSLINRVATRLSVPADDIRRFVGEADGEIKRSLRYSKRSSYKQRQQENSNQENQILPPLVIDNRAVRFLCQMLLTVPEARSEICSSPEPDFLKNLAGSHLLSKIWQGSFDPASNADVAAFANSLTPPEQACVARLLTETLPDTSVKRANECLETLHRQSLDAQKKGILSLLKDSKLPREKAHQLTKELLDLTQQLQDIAQSQ
ncbi:MAG: DNA primase [Verrucomicrobiales bacterium]|nr:DNA primase [Verrucomicrobiales bacterium]